MLAGVGEDLGSIDSEDDLAHLEHPHLYGHGEHLLKAAFEQRLIGSAEGADAVVIGGEGLHKADAQPRSRRRPVQSADC